MNRSGRGTSARLNLGGGVPLSAVKPESLLRLAEPAAMEKALLAGATRGGTVPYGVLYDQFRLGGVLRANFARGIEKPLGTANYDYLKRALAVSTIDRIIIAARQAQIRHIARLVTPTSSTLGITVRHKHWDDPNMDTGTPQVRERCLHALALLDNWDRRVHSSFTSFLTAASEDNLAFDRVVLLKEKNARDEVIRYWSLDGTTIRPTLELLIPRARKAAASLNVPVQTVMAEIETNDSLRASLLEQLSAQISQTTGTVLDLTRADYVQVINGDLITGAWREDQLGLLVGNPTNRINHWGYGVSPFENSLELTDLIMAASQYNASLFNQQYPENLLLLGAGYDQQSLQELKEHLRTAGSNQDKRLGLLSVDTDEGQSIANQAQLVRLRESPRDMAFMELLMLAMNLKCFSYDTRVETDTGRMWIGKIATQRLPVKIKSFDRQTGQIVWAQVTDWQCNPAQRDWVRLTFPTGKRTRHLEITPDHELWTQRGMVAARNLDPDTDRIYVESPVITSDQEQVILGGLLGNMSCPCPRRTALLSMSHSERQRDYMEWKFAALTNLSPSMREHFVKAKRDGSQKYAALEMATRSAPVLNQYRELCYDAQGIKRFSWEWLSKIKELGLAVWFMDNGNVYQQRHQKAITARIELMPANAEELAMVIRYFIEYWNLYPRVSARKTSRSFLLRFSKQDSARLLEIISPWVESVGRQNGEQWYLRKHWKRDAPVPIGPDHGLVPVRFQMEHLRLEKPRCSYDVTVEPTHTLLAHHVASSNCAAYSMHPSTINIREMAGQGITFQQPGTEEFKISQAEEAGFHSLIQTLCGWLTRELVAPVDDELEVTPLNLERENATQQAQLLQLKEHMTVNEKRIADNMKPFAKGDKRGDKLLSQIGVQIDNAVDSAAQWDDQVALQRQQMAQDKAGQQQEKAEPTAKSMGKHVQPVDYYLDLEIE